MKLIYPDRVSDYPVFLLPALLSAGGICAADWLYPLLADRGPWAAGVWGIAGLSAVLLTAGWNKRTVLAWAVSLMFFWMGGVRLVTVRNAYHCDWPEERPLTLRVAVRSVSKVKAKSWQAEVQVLRGPYAGRRIRAGLTRRAGEELWPGDELLLRAVVEPPRSSGNPGSFDYARWLRLHGVEGTAFCYANSWKRVGTAEPLSWPVRFLRWRQQLVSRYAEYFDGEALGVMAALTLGDKSLLTASTRDVFSESGTSHLLALSGLHLSILFGSLLWLIYRLPARRLRRWLTAALVPCIWLFVLLAGAPLSMIRAAIMLSLVLLARTLGRSAFAPDNWALAALIILLIWPQALFDVGFQLSFLSVAGILTVSPHIPRIVLFEKSDERHRSGRGNGVRIGEKALTAAVNFFFGLIVISLCAQVATAPLVAGVFRVLPLYGVPAGLIGIPVAHVLLTGGLLFFFFPPVAVVLRPVFRFLFDSLSFLADLPFSSVPCSPSPGVVFLCYGLLLVLYVWWRRRDSRWMYGAGCLVAGLGVMVVADRFVHPLRPQMVFYQVYGAPALHCISSARESYLWTTRSEICEKRLSRVAATFWKNEGLAPPCLLRADTVAKGLHYVPHVLTFHDWRVGLLYERLPAVAKGPLPVTHLFLVRGYDRPLQEALRVFRPDTLVLDASLSDFYRLRYRHEADSLHLPLHDLRGDGALVLVGEKGFGRRG